MFCTPPSKYIHLANESVLVNLATSFSIGVTRCLGPHLLRILQYHVAMPIERLDASKNFPVIALVDPEARTTNPEIPSTVYALQPFLPEQTLSQPNGVLKNTFRCQRVNHWLDIEHSKSLLPEDRLLLENG